MGAGSRLIDSPEAFEGAKLADDSVSGSTDFDGVVSGTVINNDDFVAQRAAVGEDALQVAVRTGFVSGEDGGNNFGHIPTYLLARLLSS